MNSSLAVHRPSGPLGSARARTILVTAAFAVRDRSRRVHRRSACGERDHVGDALRRHQRCRSPGRRCRPGLHGDHDGRKDRASQRLSRPAGLADVRCDLVRRLPLRGARPRGHLREAAAPRAWSSSRCRSRRTRGGPGLRRPGRPHIPHGRRPDTQDRRAGTTSSGSPRTTSSARDGTIRVMRVGGLPPSDMEQLARRSWTDRSTTRAARRGGAPSENRAPRMPRASPAAPESGAPPGQRRPGSATGLASEAGPDASGSRGRHRRR